MTYKTEIKETGVRYKACDAEIETRDGKISKLSISSEFSGGVRYFWETGEKGIEVLSHERGHINTDWMRGGLSLLWNHDPNAHIGVLEDLRVTKNKIVGQPRFDQNDLAQEKQQSYTDRTLTRSSLGYTVDEYRVERRKGQMPVYRAVSWTPLEGSLVTVPFDPTVGQERNHADMKVKTKFRSVTMSDDVIFEDDRDEDTQTRDVKPESDVNPAPEVKPDIDFRNQEEAIRIAREEGAKEEQDRRSAIIKSCEVWEHLPRVKEERDKAIAVGTKAEDFNQTLLRLIHNEQPKSSFENSPGYLDIEPDQAKRYSIGKIARALWAKSEGHPKWDKDIGFELECHREVVEACDKAGEEKVFRGIAMPVDCYLRQNWGLPEGMRQDAYQAGLTTIPVNPMHQRVSPPMNTVDTASLVGTFHDAVNFIEALRVTSAAMRMGVTVLPGLRQNVDIPKQTGVSSYFWLAEDTAPTDSEVPIGTVQLRPTTLGIAVPITRRLLLQSLPLVDAIVRNDVVIRMGDGIDNGVTEGSGASEQPMGILNQTGIGSVTIAAASDFNLATYNQFEETVLNANAGVGSFGFLGQPSWIVSGKGQPVSAIVESGTPNIWAAAGGGRMLIEGSMVTGYRGYDGYPFIPTTNMTSAGLLFGNFSQALLGLWGALDIVMDTATKIATGGLVIRGWQDLDANVRHAQAFARSSG